MLKGLSFFFLAYYTDSVVFVHLTPPPLAMENWTFAELGTQQGRGEAPFLAPYG